MPAAASETTIALGPVGAAGLIALVVGLVRRRPLVCALAVAAVVADATVPALHGLAAVRAAAPGRE